MFMICSSFLYFLTILGNMLCHYYSTITGMKLGLIKENCISFALQCFQTLTSLCRCCQEYSRLI